MANNISNIVSKVLSFCYPLRDVGVGYGDNFICDKIEETISQSLLQAESLRQSILKQAFEGKLVIIKNY